MRLHPRSDLKLFAVATEVTISDSDMRLIAYGLSFAFTARISSGAYGPLDGVPTNYVIDRGGVVRYAKAEPFDVASLDDVLSPLLAEPTPAQPAARS